MLSHQRLSFLPEYRALYEQSREKEFTGPHRFGSMRMQYPQAQENSPRENTDFALGEYPTSVKGPQAR